MKINKIQLLAFSGILGSLIMFIGDMLLYYEPVSGPDYDSVSRMSEMPIERLIAGGIVGPLASIFSIIGSYLFYIVFKSVNSFLASVLFVSFSILFIFGGSYHAMFPNLGFVGRLPELIQTDQIVFIKTYLNSINTIIYICGTLWTLIIFYLVIFKKTLYPKWLLLFTPTLLILLSGIVKNNVPYPFGAIIYGGWINLCFMIYFCLCLIHFSRNSTKLKFNNLENREVTSN